MCNMRCCDNCRNNESGCWSTRMEDCVRFMPLDGTNLTKINGVVETPPEVDYDKFSQYFMNWLDSMGWIFCGGFKAVEDDDN